jgi:hypothetical protein
MNWAVLSEVIYVPTDLGEGVENRRVFNVLVTAGCR